MSRQRADVHETGFGPLFAPPIERLVGNTDPATSRKAAEAVRASGAVLDDAAYLVDLIERHPGGTMAGYGALAAAMRGGDPYRWRLKLGRRTGTLQAIGAIHADGQEHGMSLWWPGRHHVDPR
jgi:hypothetical protein